MRTGFFAALLPFLMSPSLWADQTVELASTEYPPYYGKSLENGGPITEIVVEAFKQAGYSANVRFYPWARALSLGKQGEIGGISGIWHSDEREQWFGYSEPLMDNEVVLMKRRGEEPARFTTFSALKGFTIGTVRGYANPVGFDEAELNTEEVTEDLQNLRKLAQHRVDLILIDKGVARYLLQTAYPDLLDAFEALEPAVEKIPLYLATSKNAADHDRRLRDFNLGLQRLKDSGQLDRILVKHGFDPQ